LRFAITSPPSGCEGDLHPQAVVHARRTWKRAEPVAPPFVLRFDSLPLLFQVGWDDLAGFCRAIARRYCARRHADSGDLHSVRVPLVRVDTLLTICRGGRCTGLQQSCIALFHSQ
jgi:hypothetical protein